MARSKTSSGLLWRSSSKAEASEPTHQTNRFNRVHRPVPRYGGGRGSFFFQISASQPTSKPTMPYRYPTTTHSARNGGRGGMGSTSKFAWQEGVFIRSILPCLQKPRPTASSPLLSMVQNTQQKFSKNTLYLASFNTSE